MSDMQLAQAKEIVSQAHKYNAWEGDLVNLSDDQALSDAPQMVQLARNAYGGGVRSDAVMEILFAAQVAAPEETPNIYDEVYARHPDADRPAASPAPAEPATGNAFADAVAKEGGDQAKPSTDAAATPASLDSIFPGYDDTPKNKIVELIISSAKSGDLTEAEWEAVKNYETANEERSSILKLEPEFKKNEPAPAPPNRPPGSDTSDYGSSDALQAAYQDGSLGMDRATQQGLFIPPRYDGESPTLPIDITAISDEELSRLTMRYHSLESHTLWLASQEEGRRDVAKGLSGDAWADAFKAGFERLKSALEKETGTAIDAARSEAKHDAETDDTVRTWRNREHRHSAEARTLNALSAGYDKAASRLSREQSRRERLAASPNGK